VARHRRSQARRDTPRQSAQSLLKISPSDAFLPPTSGTSVLRNVANQRTNLVSIAIRPLR
jgi:hypothetical protein